MGALARPRCTENLLNTFSPAGRMDPCRPTGGHVHFAVPRGGWPCIRSGRTAGCCRFRRWWVAWRSRSPSWWSFCTSGRSRRRTPRRQHRPGGEPALPRHDRRRDRVPAVPGFRARRGGGAGRSARPPDRRPRGVVVGAADGGGPRTAGSRPSASASTTPATRRAARRGSARAPAPGRTSPGGTSGPRRSASASRGVPGRMWSVGGTDRKPRIYQHVGHPDSGELYQLRKATNGS